MTLVHKIQCFKWYITFIELKNNKNEKKMIIYKENINKK